MRVCCNAASLGVLCFCWMCGSVEAANGVWVPLHSHDRYASQVAPFWHAHYSISYSGSPDCHVCCTYRQGLDGLLVQQGGHCALAIV